MHKGTNYVGGEWTSSHRTFEKTNPSNGAVISEWPISDGEDVASAVKAAREAFPVWRAISSVKRGELLAKVAELVEFYKQNLTWTISVETGKSLNESLAEVNEALHMCQYAASQGREPYGDVVASEIATKISYTMRKPRGVVAIISPWNFPLAIGGFWCAAPALLEGNTVVWKPAPETPWIAQWVAQLYEQAGFPSGVFNVVHGQDTTGQCLVTSNVDTILFTGSREVGSGIRQIIAARGTNTVVSCELGSKSACLVFEDANLDMAIDASVASAFKLSGQRCVSSGRILIQRAVYDEFCKEFVARAEQIKPGDPFSEPAPFCGPLISQSQVDRVQMFNDMVRKDKDFKVLLDGEMDRSAGSFIHPFVYKGEWGNKASLKNEVFGPHVALVPFDTEDDAIRIYNDTDYGLAVGVLTNVVRIQQQCICECEYGMIYINGGSIAAESHLPFGGVKASGNGFRSAAGTWRAVTEEVTVTHNFGTTLQFPQGMKN